LVTFTALEAYPNLIADRFGSKFVLKGSKLSESMVRLKILGEKLLISERSSIWKKLEICFKDLDPEFSGLKAYGFASHIELLTQLRNRLTHPKAELHGEMKSDGQGRMRVSTIWRNDSLWSKLVEKKVLREPGGWEEALHLTNSLTAQPKCAVWAFNTVTSVVKKIESLIATTLDPRIPMTMFLQSVAEPIHPVDAEAATVGLNADMLRYSFSK
jgi:hypothetical protein